jgi:hypothetical protein
MFSSQARAYLSGAFMGGLHALPHKHTLAWFMRDKHVSLFCLGITSEDKKELIALVPNFPGGE